MRKAQPYSSYRSLELFHLSTNVQSICSYLAPESFFLLKTRVCTFPKQPIFYPAHRPSPSANAMFTHMASVINIHASLGECFVNVYKYEIS